MFEKLSTSRVESELVAMAGHLVAGPCRFLQLLAEFDERDGRAGPDQRTCVNGSTGGWAGACAPHATISGSRTPCARSVVTVECRWRVAQSRREFTSPVESAGDR